MWGPISHQVLSPDAPALERPPGQTEPSGIKARGIQWGLVLSRLGHMASISPQE